MVLAVNWNLMKQKIQSQSGFTLIDLVVAATMTIFMMVMVTANLQKIRTSQEVRNTALDLLSSVRDTQNSILAGKIPATLSVPPEATALTFTPNDRSFQRRYVTRVNPSATTTSTPETVPFRSLVRILDITIDGAATGGAISLVTVSPYGSIYMCQGANCSYNRILRIRLEHVRTLEVRTLVVDGISGRITTE